MLARLGLTPYSFRATAAYYLSFVGLGVVTASVGPALPFLSEQVQVTLAEASGLVVAQSAGFMLGSFLAGPLTDRLRPTACFSSACWSAPPAPWRSPTCPTFPSCWRACS